MNPSVSVWAHRACPTVTDYWGVHLFVLVKYLAILKSLCWYECLLESGNEHVKFHHSVTQAELWSYLLLSSTGSPHACDYVIIFYPQTVSLWFLSSCLFLKTPFWSLSSYVVINISYCLGSLSFHIYLNRSCQQVFMAMFAYYVYIQLHTCFFCGVGKL